MTGGIKGEWREVWVAWSDWPGALTEPRSARVGRATEMVAALEDQNHVSEQRLRTRQPVSSWWLSGRERGGYILVEAWVEAPRPRVRRVGVTSQR